MQTFLSFLVHVVVCGYFKYLSLKESKKMKEKLETIKEDKDMKEAIQNCDVKEIARIIKYYREYNV